MSEQTFKSPETISARAAPREAVFKATASLLFAICAATVLNGCTNAGQPNDVINAQRRARERALKAPPQYLNMAPGLAPDLPPPPPPKKKDD